MLKTPDGVFKRVMLGGTVTFTRMDGDHLILHVSFLRSHQIRVVVKHSEHDSRENLVGAKVELSGFASPLPDPAFANLSGLQLFVPDLDEVVIYQRGKADRFNAPLIPHDGLEAEHRRSRESRLIRVRGELKAGAEAGEVVLKSGRRFVTIHPIEQTEIKPGTLTEASGFVWRDGENYFVDRAVLRVATHTTNAPPIADELPILQTAQAVRGLSVSAAEKNYPVDINGVVTYYDRSWRVLFIQDATSGIYVDKKDRTLSLKPGDRIRVRGVSDPGGFAPMVVASQIHHIGTGEIPAAREVPFGRLISGAEDSQWIRLRGTVESVSRSAKNLRIQMRHAEGPFEAILVGEAKLLKQTNWIGARLNLTGICGIRPNAYRQPVGILMHIPAIEHIEFLDTPPSDPFNIAITPLDRLLEFRPDGESPRQVKVNGVVTYAGNSGLTALQDDTQAILLKFPTNRIPPMGVSIDVLGFAAPGRLTPTLRRPRWQSLGETNLPQPAKITAQMALSDEFANRYATVEATVIENHSASAVPSITLRNRGVAFRADLSASATERYETMPPGSVIRLTGVCNVQTDEWNSPRSFTLLIPPASDPTVIKRPPLFTQTHITAMAGALGVVVCLALLWVKTLRTRVAAQTRQISEELAARDQISKRYNEIVENARDLIFTLSPLGTFTAVNRSAEQAFDQPRTKLLDQPIGELLTGKCVIQLHDTLTKLSSDQPDRNLELELAGDEGGILDVAIHLQSHADGTTDIQCIARNITRRRQLEEQIRQMQKMESVGQLAAGIAHDYNNLMTIIMGNTEMLLEETPLNGEDAELLEEVHGAATRASRLTGQLMTFSRKQIMKATLLDPGAVVGGLKNIIKRTLGETIRVSSAIPEKLPTIIADHGMIEQVLINLAINARDAMPDGGELTITVTGLTVTPEQADQHRDALPGEHVRISVQDTGKGMEPALLSRIFEPFFTTKDVGKGTGLGLSTVYGIAKQHHGWVEAQSTVGQGSTFEVYFPTTDDTPPTTLSDSTLESDCRGDETILLVEDSERVRETMRKVLRRAGYQVIEAVDGPNAREQWKQHRDAIDLLLTDMVMPQGMSGRDLAKDLRRDNPHLLVVFCSGYSEELSALSQLTSRERILPKPFENKALLQIIRDVIDAAVAIGN
ncbi:MAG: ATP-binding protein [Limisphaerales bacterium]